MRAPQLPRWLLVTGGVGKSFEAIWWRPGALVGTLVWLMVAGVSSANAGLVPPSGQGAYGITGDAQITAPAAGTANATLFDDNQPSTWFFQYQLTIGGQLYVYQSAPQALPAESNPIAVSEPLYDIGAGESYDYRVVLDTPSKEVDGGWVAFDTPSGPSKAPGPGPASALPATVSSSFSPSTVDANGTTTWTLSITNPNTAASLTDVRFDMGTLVYLPIPTPTTPNTPVDISPRAITANTCGGTGTVLETPDPLSATGPGVNYSGGTLAPDATCTISVRMDPGGIYSYHHAPVPVTVLTNEGGASAVSDALLTWIAPLTRTTPPSDGFIHTKPKVARDGTITETVKLSGSGTLQLRETWRGKLVANTQKAVATARKLTIRLVPGTAVRGAVKAHHDAKLKLKLAFTPTGGNTRTITLTTHTPR